MTTEAFAYIDRNGRARALSVSRSMAAMNGRLNGADTLAVYAVNNEGWVGANAEPIRTEPIESVVA